jgi:BlaI family transcriptional regulator, penicillinase repressor
MKEQKAKAIHATEWDVLEALWAAERGTAREVSEALADKRAWAVSTVKTLLDRMTVKGLVHARQVGNVWEYTPAFPREDARRSAWAEFVQKAFGGATAPALHFLATEAKVSKKELAELRDLLDQRVSKGGRS